MEIIDLLHRSPRVHPCAKGRGPKDIRTSSRKSGATREWFAPTEIFLRALLERLPTDYRDHTWDCRGGLRYSSMRLSARHLELPRDTK